MSKISVQLATENIIRALKRCEIRYRLVHSKMSESRYLNIYNSVGVCIFCIRIAAHPVYGKSLFVNSRKADINIGNFSEAEYGLDEWYKVLEDISDLVRIIEVRRMCSKIIAEEETRKKEQTEAFKSVLRNIRNKAMKPRYTPNPDLTAEVFIELSGDFAVHFGYTIESCSIGDTHFIGFRRCSGEKIQWIALSFFDKYTLPPKTVYDDIISYGQWKGSMYKSHQWDMVLQSVARSFSVMSKQARKDLNRFIACSREKYRSS